MKVDKMRKLGLGLILILVFPAFSILVPEVQAATGSLIVTAQNYGDTPAFFLPGTTTVKVIDFSGITVGSQNIDSNSRAIFNDLNAAAPYSIEVYHASGLGLGTNEFWGSATGVIVSAGGATGYVFTRSAPIFQTVQYNNSNPTVGQAVTVSVTVNNIDLFSSRRCSVRLIMDRDKISPFDFDQTSSQVTISSGSTYTFRIVFSTLVAGTYYATAVLSAVYGSSLATDQLVWSSPLTVVQPILADQNLSSSIANPGQSLTVGYYISNPSSSNISVGLGVGIRMTGTTGEINDRAADKIISVSPGSGWYYRNFAVPSTVVVGSYDVYWGIWPNLPRTGTPIQTTGWLSDLLTIAGMVSVVFSATGLGPSTSGLILTVDGVQYGSVPQTFSWTVGSSHSHTWASFVNDATSSTKAYEWVSCSGLSSLQSGTLAVPSSGGSVVASYATDYQVIFALNPPNGGSTAPTGAHWYRAGSDQSIVAQPAFDYSFQNWNVSTLSSISILNSSSASTSLTINGAGTITASFSSSVIPEFSPLAMLFVLMALTTFLFALLKRKTTSQSTKTKRFVIRSRR
jgi:hypothetical protein